MISILSLIMMYVPEPVGPQNPPMSNDEDTPDITDANDNDSATSGIKGGLLKRIVKMR